jgi:hypothetical protein
MNIQIHTFVPLAQLVERRSYEPEVTDPIPVWYSYRYFFLMCRAPNTIYTFAKLIYLNKYTANPAMFAPILQTKFFDEAEAAAKNTIIKDDRSHYTPIFDKIKEKMTDDKTIIFSNPEKIIACATKKPKKITTDIMVVFSTHTRRTTTMIANIIHENFGKFVQMRSIIPNEEYEIMYNMRSILKMYRIDRYKNVELPKLFSTTTINNLDYFPAYIELMDIYHKLYLPNFYSDWPQLLTQETQLYPLIKSEITGGEKSTCQKKRHIDISNIKLLMLQFLNNENFVMVGEWAHKLIKTKTASAFKVVPKDNIQIISENDIETDHKNILTFLSRFTGYGIFYKKRKLYVPKNNRIVKYTLYVKYPTLTAKSSNQAHAHSGIDKPFMDIYNCGTYELIPYEKITHTDEKSTNLNIGNMYVQLYFLLIDLWIIKLLKYLEGIEQRDFNARQTYIFDTIKFIKSDTKQSSTFRHGRMFMGINYDEKTAQKIIISKNQIKKTSYYPELSIKDTKKYQLIATS